MAAINHHTGKTFVDALLAEFKGISVVQMYCNRDIGKTQRSLNELFQIYRIGVLPRAFGNLEHHGRLFLFTGLHNRLEEFMLLTLNAPMAYLPLSALLNSSLVCVSGMVR